MTRIIRVISLFILCTMIISICSAANETSSDWQMKGTAYAKAGELDEAINAYNTSIELNQSNYEAWIEKGNIYQKLTRFEDAVFAYDTALKIQSQLIPALNGKANALKSLGRYDEALTSMNEAIEINVNYTSGYLNKAGILQKLNNYEEAVAAYDKAIELDPKSLGAYLSKAGTLQSMKKYDAAIAEYDKVIAINSSFIPAYTGKAGVLTTQKRLSEAEHLYDEAIRIDPDAIWAWNGRGGVLVTMNRYQEAISSYDHVIAINETYAPAWRSKANALLKLKKTSEAMDAFNQTLANDPNLTGAWMEKGNLEMSMQNYQAGLESYEQAIRINASDASAWNAKGKALLAQEQYSDAVTAFNEALNLNQNLTDARKNRETAQFKIFIASNESMEIDPEPTITAQIAETRVPLSDSVPQTSSHDSWISGMLAYFFGGNPAPVKSNPPTVSGGMPDHVRLISPVDMHIDGQWIYIVDDGNNSVIKMDYNGTISLVLGGPERPDLFTDVVSVTCDPLGNMYTLDAGSGIVNTFDCQGQLLNSWGSLGSGPAQFSRPQKIEYSEDTGSKEELLFVTDTGNYRIQTFTLDGEYRTSITSLYKGKDLIPINDHILPGNYNNTYKGINPVEHANPPLVDRNFQVKFSDTLLPLKFTVDRRQYLGAQQNSALDFDVNAQNPEQWEQTLKDALNDPVTTDTLKITSAVLMNSSCDKKLTDGEKLDLLCTFIQQIPLVNETDKRYPIEIIHDKKGSSSDKALFLYGLLYHAGYDVIFLSFPGTNHCAVAIKTDKPANKAVIAEYSLQDTGYVYINPDTPSLIGKGNPVVSGVDPFMIHLLSHDSGHTGSLDDREKRLFVLETLDKIENKINYLESQKGKYSGPVKKVMQGDLDKIKTVKAYVENNVWNTEGIVMRLKNSKVGDIQLNYGL